MPILSNQLVFAAAYIYVRARFGKKILRRKRSKVLFWAAVMYIAPLFRKLLHYTWATIKNIYIDIKYLGLGGTLMYRAKLRPRM